MPPRRGSKSASPVKPSKTPIKRHEPPSSRPARTLRPPSVAPSNTSSADPLDVIDNQSFRAESDSGDESAGEDAVPVMARPLSSGSGGGKRKSIVRRVLGSDGEDSQERSVAKEEGSDGEPPLSASKRSFKRRRIESDGSDQDYPSPGHLPPPQPTSLASSPHSDSLAAPALPDDDEASNVPDGAPPIDAFDAAFMGSAGTDDEEREGPGELAGLDVGRADDVQDLAFQSMAEESILEGRIPARSHEGLTGEIKSEPPQGESTPALPLAEVAGEVVDSSDDSALATAADVEMKTLELEEEGLAELPNRNGEENVADAGAALAEQDNHIVETSIPAANAERDDPEREHDVEPPRPEEPTSVNHDGGTSHAVQPIVREDGDVAKGIPAEVGRLLANAVSTQPIQPDAVPLSEEPPHPPKGASSPHSTSPQVQLEDAGPSRDFAGEEGEEELDPQGDTEMRSVGDVGEVQSREPTVPPTEGVSTPASASGTAQGKKSKPASKVTEGKKAKSKAAAGTKKGAKGIAAVKARVAARSESIAPSTQDVSEASTPQPNEDAVKCICGKPYTDEDEGQTWIGCDSCDSWFHPACVGLSEDKLDLLENYICKTCERRTHQKTIWKVSCKRAGCNKSVAGRASKFCSKVCGFKHAQSIVDGITNKKSLKQLTSALIAYPSPPPSVNVTHHLAPAVPEPLPPPSTPAEQKFLADLDLQLARADAAGHLLDKRRRILEQCIARCESLGPVVNGNHVDEEAVSKKARKKGAGGGGDDKPCGWEERLIWSEEEVEAWNGGEYDGGGDICMKPRRRCERHGGWQKTVAVGLDVEAGSLARRKTALIEEKAKLDRSSAEQREADRARNEVRVKLMGRTRTHAAVT